MYNFNNDYSEGATTEVWTRLIDENMKTHNTYGLDDHSLRAADLIKEKMASKTADVHFLVGGTQTNMILIASVLKPYQAVISVASGHINVHETGAIEGQGNKILSCEGVDGKLTPDGIRSLVLEHRDEHMVSPKLVYLSQTSEFGTIYSLAELENIHTLCQELGLYLYIDGARLGSALTAATADFTLADMARLCDAFSIGGTKNGLLFGEALVLMNPAWQHEFRYQIKHFGGMLAKGFLTGIQFEVLFENELYFDLARHANKQAASLAVALERAGVEFYTRPVSNQLFIIISQALKQHLAKSFSFSVHKELANDMLLVRLVTSWATTDKAVLALIAAVEDFTDNENKAESR